jgi:hypothetical protein
LKFNKIIFEISNVKFTLYARGAGFDDLLYFFAGVKNFACGAIFLTFSGLPFHENFAIGPFSPKISLAAPFNVYFLLVQGAQKSKLPGAREDRNPALSFTLLNAKF